MVLFLFFENLILCWEIFFLILLIRLEVILLKLIFFLFFEVVLYELILGVEGKNLDNSILIIFFKNVYGSNVLYRGKVWFGLLDLLMLLRML